jgi:hypothetical protein
MKPKVPIFKELGMKVMPLETKTYSVVFAFLRQVIITRPKHKTARWWRHCIQLVTMINPLLVTVFSMSTVGYYDYSISEGLYDYKFFLSSELTCNWLLAVVKHFNKLSELNYYYYFVIIILTTSN